MSNTENTNEKSFRRVVRVAMAERGIESWQQLADEMGCSRTAISLAAGENGHRYPRMRRKIADFLQLPLLSAA